MRSVLSALSVCRDPDRQTGLVVRWFRWSVSQREVLRSPLGAVQALGMERVVQG